MIWIENLCFRYGKTPLYDDFNLFIPEDQVCLVTGINGVGKSTLLRLIAGVLRPDSGVIRFAPRLGPLPKQRIGFISDRLSLYESLTVRQSIALHMAAFSVPKFDDSLLLYTKIKPRQRVRELSIGQRTILHLSLILSARPEILLIDEVIHAIDAHLRHLFLQKIVEQMAERHLTIIMVNVNFHDIEHIVNRVILLRNGAVAVDEPIEELKEKVKKVVGACPPPGLPILSRIDHGGQSEFFIYPFGPEMHRQAIGEVIDLNLTEIVAAFIGREYD